MKMNISSLLLILLALHSSWAAINNQRADELYAKVENTPFVQANPTLVQTVRESVLRNGCNVNLCFVLHGSNEVTSEGFNAQKDYARLITALIGADDGAKFAGVQYGLVNSDISTITNDASTFLDDVGRNVFLDSSFSFTSAGIGFCINQLDDPPVAAGVNKVLFLAAGKANFGDLTGVLSPKAIVERWKGTGTNNAVYAVGIGFPGSKPLADIVGGPEFVVDVPQFDGLINSLTAAVGQICGIAELAPDPNACNDDSCEKEL